MDYNRLAAEETVNKTVAALNINGIETFVVESGADALTKIKELIHTNDINILTNDKCWIRMRL